MELLSYPIWLVTLSTLMATRLLWIFFFNPNECDSGMIVSFWLRIHCIRSSFDTFVENGGCHFDAIGFCVWAGRGQLGITQKCTVMVLCRDPLALSHEMEFHYSSINTCTTIFVNGCHTSINYEDGGPRVIPLTIQLPLTIGKRGVAVPQFAIDDIRVWHTELTPKEMWDLYSDANGNYTI